MSELNCPCGSNQSFKQCCGRYISGKQLAPTAEALMRSRYSAYATGAADYIIETWTAPVTNEHNAPSIKAWTEQVTFIKLDIIDTQAGRENDDTGIVEFCAHYIDNGNLQKLHERSQFKKIDGRWYYTQGDLS